MVGDGVADLHRAAGALSDAEAERLPKDLLSLIDAGPDAWEHAEALDGRLREGGLPARGEGEWWWPASEVRFCIPYTPRKNPWVIGANYLQHLANGYARLGRPPVGPTHVEFFTKAITAMVGDGDDIVYDKRATVTVDYEAELTVVIGREGKDLDPEDSEAHVFGYTIVNDVSARELQIGHRQYFRGKSQDGFCPIGPVIATAREIPDINALRIRQWVNGELRQDWPVGDMLFKIDKLVSELSQGMTIEPGDLIVCGTVPGVGFESMPQVWLQHGDELEIEVTRIGRLRNTVKMAGVGR